MIAVDTDILVHAHRADGRLHDPARARLMELAEGRATWAIPWPCLHEFIGVVTHPRIFNPPSPLRQALDQVSSWLESPSLVLLGETSNHWPLLVELATAARASGARIHDARIAAICRAHGVRELWTADRDFERFPGLTVRNPLVADRTREPSPSYGRPRRAGARLRRPKPAHAAHVLGD